MVDKLREMKVVSHHRREFSDVSRKASFSFQDLTSLNRTTSAPLPPNQVTGLDQLTNETARSTESETISPKTSTSSTPTTKLIATSSPHENGQSQTLSLWKGIVRILRHKNGTMGRFSSFPPFGVSRLSLSGKKKSQKNLSDVARFDSLEEGGTVQKPACRNFSIEELVKATDDFKEDNVIGKGGYAKVYLGKLENDQLVAIKRLNQRVEDERINNFLTEMGIVSHMNHPNIAKLVGVCVEGGEFLVFELSPLGNLANLLHGSKEKLNWEARFRIAVGTARGLEYLHEKCSRRIIHRDIKAANILLTENCEPQICDFGLAKWLPDKLTHHQVSIFEGTFGYLAPEYGMHGIINEKTDIFAYGVLLLELVAGRRAVEDTSKQSIVFWAKPLLFTDKIKDLVDPSLGGQYDMDQVKRVTQVAHLCIQHSPALRPSISQVLKILNGEDDKVGPTSIAQRPVLRRTFSEEVFDVEEYNATRYIKDLNRHKQIVFDS
ncbi:hypothetical protein LUZ60_015588 [Juncus effusus]|nr:hypothetical protein LUZ60_015588 [Juncus effusus]